jgi:hypothetical protein
MICSVFTDPISIGHARAEIRLEVNRRPVGGRVTGREALEIARGVLGRSPTDEERERILGVRPLPELDFRRWQVPDVAAIERESDGLLTRVARWLKRPFGAFDPSAWWWSEESHAIAQRITRAGGAATEEERSLLACAVAALPEWVLTRLELDGVAFVACSGSIFDVAPSMAALAHHALMRGHDFGLRADTQAACWTQIVYVAIERDLFGNPALPGGNPLLVLHEAGHAFDGASGMPSKHDRRCTLDSFAGRFACHYAGTLRCEYFARLDRAFMPSELRVAA